MRRPFRISFDAVDLMDHRRSIVFWGKKAKTCPKQDPHLDRLFYTHRKYGGVGDEHFWSPQGPRTSAVCSVVVSQPAAGEMSGELTFT